MKKYLKIHKNSKYLHRKNLKLHSKEHSSQFLQEEMSLRRFQFW